MENSVRALAGQEAMGVFSAYTTIQGRVVYQYKAKSANASGNKKRALESARPSLFIIASLPIRSFLEELLSAAVHLDGHTVHRGFLRDQLSDRVRGLETIKI